MAVSLGCGKDSARRVIEILKKNPKIIRQKGLGETSRGIAKIEKELAKMYEKVVLGKGSTGRIFPKNLKEQLAMKEVLSNPLSGAKELGLITMTDPRWLAEAGWIKMSKNVNGVEIHYVYNKIIKAFDDFKFKPLK